MAIIQDIMNHEIRGIHRDATLADAVRFLTERNIGWAPIVDDCGLVVGTISDSSLIDMLFDPTSNDAPVCKYMNLDVQTIQVDDRLSIAAGLFALHSFAWLPVVAGKKLVGFVTPRDLLNHALLTREVLADPLTDMIPGLVTLS